MVCLEAKPQLTRHVIYSPRGYLVPRQDGRLLAGSTSEKAGFAKCVTAGGISHDTAKRARDFACNRKSANRRYLGRIAAARPLTVCLCWGLVVKLTGCFMQPGITETESYSRL